MEISNQSSVLQNIQKRYLNPDGADVWFIFDSERIPGHRIILASSPWLESMFFGSLTEEGEVNMRHSNVSSSTFKEFLRYVYCGKANLTMDNIAEMIYLADESLDQDIFDECENFLLNRLGLDNIFDVYQLALKHERAVRLKNACEEEICVNAEETIKSSRFERIPYEFLENIVKCDSLVCDEKDLFDACIGWAKAECRRQNIFQHDPLNIRAQLRDAFYQIRFSSMTIGDAAACTQSCRDLFTVDELLEIICMVGHKEYSGTKRFNWAPRYFSLQRFTSNELVCKRYSGLAPENLYSFKKTETLEFTCTRRVMLKGLTSESRQRSNGSTRYSANISIIETKSIEDVNVRYNKKNDFVFTEEVERGITSLSRTQGRCLDHNTFKSYVAKVKLGNAILLRPGYTYTMTIAFDREPSNQSHICKLKNKVRVDHDIVLRFNESKSMVTSLILGRLHKRRYLRRVVHNPMMWFKLFLVILVLAYFIHRDINKPNSTLIHWWHLIKSFFANL